VESLIGRDTIDTIPPATLDAFRDHGAASSRLEENIDDARQVLATLARFGISLDALTARLLEEGVQEFSGAFDKLLGAVEKKVRGAVSRVPVMRAEGPSR
jgi:transaldolase/glucose-6-phosphate isomerase